MPYFQAPVQLRAWRNSPGPMAAGFAVANNSFMVAPLDMDKMNPFPGNMLAQTFGIAVSVNHATNSTQAFTSTARVGLYTRSGSTLNLVNSGTATFGYGGATSTSATWTSSFNGARILSLLSSQWSSAPYFNNGSVYWIGVCLGTNGFNGPMSIMSASPAISTAAMSGGLGAGGASVSSQNEWAIFRGALSVTTAAPPASIPSTDLVGSAGTGIYTPWVRIDDNFRNYA